MNLGHRNKCNVDRKEVRFGCVVCSDLRQMSTFTLFLEIREKIKTFLISLFLHTCMFTDNHGLGRGEGQKYCDVTPWGQIYFLKVFSNLFSAIPHLGE